MFFKDKNILVTGGCGFVGGHLVEELVKLKANVIVIDEYNDPLSYFSSQKLHQKVRLIKHDICNFDKIFEILTKHNIEYIFHLAAQPIVDIAYHNPHRTLEVNIMGTVNVLESARRFHKIKGIVFASSDKAYGKLTGYKSVPIRYKETDALRGDHPYEVSKSSADLIATAYYKTYGVPVVITRFGNIYGEGDLNFSRIIPGILKAIVNKKELLIRSNGQYVRDYLYVKDVVKGYLTVAENIDKVKGEAFNFGSLDTLSVIELILLVSKKLKRKINYRILNQAKNEIPYQALDFSKVEKLLNWKPKLKLRSVIAHIYKWYDKMFVK